MDRKNLKVLLTGGNKGLGRKIAGHLSSQGHEVYVFGRKDINLIDPALLSILAGYTECDLSDTGNVVTSFRNLINQTGGIDVLINNAAVRQFDKKADEFLSSEIQRNITVDLMVPLILSNLCLPGMKKNKFGRIINISSIGAYKAFVNGSIYCSSKTGLIAFNESLNKELSGLKGAVSVNTICPDSFSKIDGTILIPGIIESILKDIDLIINSDAVGKVINEFTFKHKLRESLRFIKRSVNMLTA